MNGHFKKIFSESLTSLQPLNDEHRSWLLSIVAKYPWFSLSKVLILKDTPSDSLEHGVIRDNMPFELLACSYFNILDLHGEEQLQEIIEKPQVEMVYEQNEQPNDDIIDIFISKNITKIRPTEEIIPIKINNDEDYSILEEVAEFMICQGKISNAIEIYCKLSLKIPEKKDYFATIIEKLNNNK